MIMITALMEKGEQTMRLIDADNLFKNNVIIVRGEDGEVVAQQMIAILHNAPTIEAELVKHGRWVEKKRWSMGKWHKWLECSECGNQDHDLDMYKDMPFIAPANYCPNCGAKMNLEE